MTETKKTTCPICGNPADEKYKPFCSKRCADVDLNRWLSGVYVIHTDERPEDGVPVSPEKDEKN